MKNQSYPIRRLPRKLALLTLFIILALSALQASALITSAAVAVGPDELDATPPSALRSTHVLANPLRLTKQLPDTILTPNEVAPFTLSVTAEKDTWVNQFMPTANYGFNMDMTLGQDSLNVDQAIPLIWFDLTTLPADAVIISATLSLYAPNPPTHSFYAQPQAISSSWVENLVNWNTQPSRTSFFDPAIELDSAGWIDFDISRSAQAWVDQEVLNYGIAIQPITGSDAYQTFTTRSSVTPPELNHRLYAPGHLNTDGRHLGGGCPAQHPTWRGKYDYCFF